MNLEIIKKMMDLPARPDCPSPFTANPHFFHFCLLHEPGNLVLG
jgi:hypothetical protein